MSNPINHFNTSCTVSNIAGNCFDFLTVEQLELIERNKMMVDYKKGEVIVKQGTFTSHIIVITEGLVKVFYEEGDQILILRIAAPQSLIGLTSLPLNQNLFQYTASAYVNTRVKLIDINIIRQLIIENSRFGAAIIDLLCEVTIQKNGRFFCLSNRQAYGKLADIILCLATNIFKSNEFELLLSRKELAELAGMSPESVIRTLKNFQDDGLIKIDGKMFSVIDPDGLVKICQLG
ncbi:MAG: Crp/Fnr family transcriptional regulator [Bacteroidales bacterium]|nr:Crp/Fnr family transcriptional regulator [Bacteroidota bacterium]MCF8347426.1 Crp/Fnr family transcriptional regulator [Bacteroidales bacterium]